MQYLLKVAPKNSIGIVGLSWIDFFPSDEWNHILGEGSVHNGCAAISFGHYSMFTDRSSPSIVSSQGLLKDLLLKFCALFIVEDLTLVQS